ncbi:transporter substrate-binding domain-containing protein [Pseudomonas rhodesiae]|uniref:Amino acid ABC transporter substrate-binding protein, PAAT family n=1 Tax=Pseudomonas rhodesiae TaxID=76760 RepID=A0AAE8KYP9_9PSED|nr:transporter substrate-binding domain-containing protein [Pseudomonas rhodesiae]TWR51293.1 amino acid ABC transporter substrate-binding protein [Pseudomonas rhodesiae]SDV00391.1 amino acid ABC transporter substrate-binding protein, PAAT family [Pseudomonas rhodesiae]
MKMSAGLLYAAMLSIAATNPASADEANGTLKKIKNSGAIVLAYRDSAIPFSYLDNDQQTIGYSWDIANAVAARVKSELKMQNLEIKGNLVTSQTRIPLVQNGTVDIECGVTTNNIERQQQVDFSVGIFQASTRLLTKATSGVKDFSDLQGKNVVTTAGTTSERLLKIMNADKQMGMNIISAKDHSESFQMVQSGRAVAFMLDDVLLAGFASKTNVPSDWVITGQPQSHEIYGCMVRKGDPSFKKVVDEAIKDLYQSGKINTLYSKWFESPVPPKGQNLNFPLPKELKALIDNPTDKAADQL